MNRFYIYIYIERERERERERHTHTHTHTHTLASSHALCVCDEAFFFFLSIINFNLLIYFILIKNCGGFEFAKCLKIFLFKIEENVKEARKKNRACVFKFFKKG